MKEYTVRYRDITNKKTINVKVTAESPFKAHTKADVVMRRTATSYYWIDTIPSDWI